MILHGSRKDSKRKADPGEDANGSKGEQANEDDAECKDDEATLVRSIRYRLEKLDWRYLTFLFPLKILRTATCVGLAQSLLPRTNFAMKDRALSVRELTWVFEPALGSG